MNPTTNERLKQIGRIFIYIVLVVFLIRNLVDVYRQITTNDDPVVQQTNTSTEVPDTAKSVAKLFLLNWYFIDPNQKDTDRLSNLEPFVTADLFDYINTNSDLRVVNNDSSLIDQTTNQNQNTKTQSSTTNGTENKSFEGVSAKEVDVWQAIWKDQKANKVQIIARMQTSDNKTMFLSVPVEKSGSTWQVSALPALIAAPKGSEKAEEPVEIDISAKQEAIRTVLEDFFSDWLKGNKEAITRYMVDGKPLPTTDWEEELDAEFVGVQNIKPESENPLRVSVVISMKDANNVEFQLNYHVTFQEKSGKLFIVSIN